MSDQCCEKKAFILFRYMKPYLPKVVPPYMYVCCDVISHGTEKAESASLNNRHKVLIRNIRRLTSYAVIEKKKLCWPPFPGPCNRLAGKPAGHPALGFVH